MHRTLFSFTVFFTLLLNMSFYFLLSFLECFFCVLSGDILMYSFFSWGEHRLPTIIILFMERVDFFFEANAAHFLWTSTHLIIYCQWSYIENSLYIWTPLARLSFGKKSVEFGGKLKAKAHIISILRSEKLLLHGESNMLELFYEEYFKWNFMCWIVADILLLNTTECLCYKHSCLHSQGLSVCNMWNLILNGRIKLFMSLSHFHISFHSFKIVAYCLFYKRYIYISFAYTFGESFNIRANIFEHFQFEY